MMLNLGNGDQYCAGWTNVDFDGSPHQRDETADLRDPLPWSDVTHAYAGHLLEHLRVGACVEFLQRLQHCMARGGELMVVGPDVDIAAGMAAVGQLDTPMEWLLYGAKRWPGDEHRWECAAHDVVALLTATGWQDVTSFEVGAVPPLWPVANRGALWQCAVSAVAP